MNNHKLVGLSEPTESQDAATRGYIKNFTRNNFLKLDGTNNMAGGLDLNNNKITNIVADPTEDDDAATKQYVNSRKPLITIWAQENGPLNAGEYEWSFGSGDLYILKKCGYCMPAAGRIISGSISSVSESGTAEYIMVWIRGGSRNLRKGGHNILFFFGPPPASKLAQVPKKLIRGGGGGGGTPTLFFSERHLRRGGGGGK